MPSSPMIKSQLATFSLARIEMGLQQSKIKVLIHKFEQIEPNILPFKRFSEVKKKMRLSVFVVLVVLTIVVDCCSNKWSNKKCNKLKNKGGCDGSDGQKNCQKTCGHCPAAEKPVAAKPE